jgi:hypothetical protein
MRPQLVCSFVWATLRGCGIVARCDRDEIQFGPWRRVSGREQPLARHQREVFSSNIPKSAVFRICLASQALAA